MQRFDCFRLWIFIIFLSFLQFSCAALSPSERSTLKNIVDKLNLGTEKLNENLGNPFPNITMIGSDDEGIPLEAFRGKRLAILMALPNCSTEWLREFQENFWNPPQGYDELIVLFYIPGSKEFTQLVKLSPNNYMVEWPLIDYLSCVKVCPIMYFVSAEGIFEGYQTHGSPPITVNYDSNNK